MQIFLKVFIYGPDQAEPMMASSDSLCGLPAVPEGDVY